MTEQLRSHFPIFQQVNAAGATTRFPWVYLDSAATSQKPQSVLAAIEAFYTTSNANVHRASHDVARRATLAYEAARVQVAKFINASSATQIVWTKGATESVNLLSCCITPSMLNQGKRILLSATEHHANIVPWQQFAKRMGMTLDIIPISDQGVWLLDDALALLTKDTALVAIGHVSNALGNINPIEPLIKKAKQLEALCVIDGAQAPAHMTVDVSALDCDFYLFSGHKMFAPTGIGVLYGKQDLLEAMRPFQYGGEMIKTVSFETSTFHSAPQKFEPGTPNIEGVIGLSAAIDFIQQHRAAIHSHEQALYAYLLAQLGKLGPIQLWGDTNNSVSIQSFTVTGIDNQDLGILLNEQNIAVRVGHHCTMPLMSRLGVSGTIRVSLGCYNTFEEIDYFIQALQWAIAEFSSEPVISKPIDAELRASSVSSVNYPLGEQVRNCSGWDEKYRQIMLAGKHLTRLSADEQTIKNEVKGCESHVWLILSIDKGRLIIQGDSPSKIIRGLLALLIERLNHTPLHEVLTFDVVAYLTELGVEKHLSQSRGNGMRAIVQHIEAFALTNVPSGESGVADHQS